MTKKRGNEGDHNEEEADMTNDDMGDYENY